MKVSLLGTSFTLQSDESQEYLEELVAFYQNKVEEITKSVETRDPIKLAILSGILVVDELFKLKQDIRSDEGQKLDMTIALDSEGLEEAERITLDLIKKIESTLEDAAMPAPIEDLAQGEDSD